jgi:hypothetical protein
VALGHDPVYGAANGAPPCAGLRARDHSLGLVVEGGEDRVGVLFRVVKSQAADRESGDGTSVTFVIRPDEPRVRCHLEVPTEERHRLWPLASLVDMGLASRTCAQPRLMIGSGIRISSEVLAGG